MKITEIDLTENTVKELQQFLDSDSTSKDNLIFNIMNDYGIHTDFDNERNQDILMDSCIHHGLKMKVTLVADSSDKYNLVEYRTNWSKIGELYQFSSSYAIATKDEDIVSELGNKKDAENMFAQILNITDFLQDYVEDGYNLVLSSVSEKDLLANTVVLEKVSFRYRTYESGRDTMIVDVEILEKELTT